MEKAANRNRGFSAAETALLDRFDGFAQAYKFAFDFEPGDVQFVNNYTVLHGREAHQPAADEDQTRLLMRIWVDIEGFRPHLDPSIMRYGTIRHGKLGWRAADVLAGLEGKQHPRRADGAPLL